MENKDKSTTSIIPFDSTGLVKVGSDIAITNKILTERNAITQHHWNWWNWLSDIWKKIFNAEIGKIKNRPTSSSANYINEHGTTETPSDEELYSTPHS